jgi:UPF0755 protein
MTTGTDWLRVGGGLLLAVVLLLAMLLVAAEYDMRRASPAARSGNVVVVSGASLRSVLQELGAQGVLRHPRLVEIYLRLRDRQFAVRTGTYQIPPQLSALQVLDRLRRGLVQLEQLTIIEGWSFAQMRQALDANPSLTPAMRGRSDAELMAALGHPGQHPEGRFFPDTYKFAVGSSDSRIYELAYARMARELAAAWEARDARLPLRDADEALILASIVEKETAREDERTAVAAVFSNRLRIGMRLQSDPTVIYGLGSRFDGDLRSRDLLADGPYNSYTRAGLPPTPIALPGLASLRAATRPADSKALYFVATGAGDGSHHFSSTLAEHNAAVRRFLQRTGARPSRAQAVRR